MSDQAVMGATLQIKNGILIGDITIVMFTVGIIFTAIMIGNIIKHIS